MRHRERERQRHRRREKQAPCREPDAGLDSGYPGSGPGLKAALTAEPPGCPTFIFNKTNDIPHTTEKVSAQFNLT